MKKEKNNIKTLEKRTSNDFFIDIYRHWNFVNPPTCLLTILDLKGCAFCTIQYETKSKMFLNACLRNLGI